MSGDVQPRKRKDKKRKKDDLGVDEPRGTAAALGEGDVFMHSPHDHGTGGHWCAKVIFFSLLFVLVGLIGLIILENRGLSELEANAVQSQYSGVLEGWLEDAPEDDHHDEHTLELNHHDDDHDDDHGNEHGEVEHSEEADDEHDDEEHDDEEELEDDEEGSQEDDDETQDEDDEAQDVDDEDESQEHDLEANDEEEDLPYRKYYHGNEAEPDDDEDDQDEQDNDSKNDDDEDEEQDEQSNEVDQDDDENEEYNQSVEQNDDEDNDRDDEANSIEQNEDEEEDHEDEEEDTSLEVEKIEKEAPVDEEPISVELPALPEQEDDDDDNDGKPEESVEDEAPDADDADDADDVEDADNDDDANESDDDFLEADDDEPPVERITAPAGKPFAEVEEETSSEKPTDTLAEEEEYEQRQEQLRREEAEASHMWLKLSIGGALLVATHAIMRRATASSDVPRSEERTSREETPPIERRMTLIPEEPSPVPIKKVSQESSRPVIQEVTKQIPSITKSSPTFEESEDEVEEEEEEPVVSKIVRTAQAAKSAEKEELYSDEEEAEEEEVEEEPVVAKKVAPAATKPPPPKEPTPEPEEDVPDDVEIIDDEQIEEDVEEEVEDEEEISDVDDEELLTRLEAKYGRLPEPERPGRRKDGGNSIEDQWPGEPADAYWRQQLDDAEREFNQGALARAAERASAAPLRGSARARLLLARALDADAERRKDNALLGRAIAAYLDLLKMNERLPDKKLLEVAERTINRIQFRGTYLSAEPVYRLLIRRFPDEPSHRTNLTVMFLMANRGDLAEDVLKETLKRWPNDRLALAQYGFILKTQHNRLEEALDHLQRALEGDTGPATEPRFYYHLGDTLLLLGRYKEAHEVHKRGAAHGHFLSPSQRSLYNAPGLRGRPWWKIEDTPYTDLARALEKNWPAILKEGEAAKALYEQEKEGLKERGEWSQLDLFVRGREIAGRCARAPVTCSVVKSEAAAAGCRRGQIKFSSMHAGTHVRPHVGPTNCRLRMHLGLSNTKDTFIRVDRETRQWATGKVFMFDDSFEHEVWHNGTGSRLVLIVDVWHPDLTPSQRRQLPAI